MAMQVRKHVHLGECLCLERSRSLLKRHGRPIAGANLTAVPQPLPERLHVIGTLRASFCPQEEPPRLAASARR